MRATGVGLLLVETDESTVQSPTAHTSAPPARGPAPKYRPSIGDSDVQISDPRYAQLDGLREKAWQKGITDRELSMMHHGPCNAQINLQIEEVTDWIAAH